jgi:hypothetical protein
MLGGVTISRVASALPMLAVELHVNALEVPMTRPTRKGAKNWTSDQWEAVFDTHPPTGPHPSREQLEVLSGRLGRSVDAIGWMWEDANAEILGKPSTASERLRAYLRERGWLAPAT